ncbi:MAG: monovalent cation:proton antiporter-2 (CPA2) family protein [Proteobacteria bacterium]|nr:monovalent cation:proton antiporter-2 (CPA2) family protein [Pseudomonadota bacterium]
MDTLTQAAVFFGAAVLVVPIFRRLGLGAVLGYLAAGAVIGPFGLSLIADVEAAAHLAEFGVVLLLFIIGLELNPTRLWTMRSLVFGLGSAQVFVTGALLAVAGVYFGLGTGAAIVTGVALAFSSTAFVLQTLAERGELKDRHGRAAFAVLLFQDIAAIPLLAAVPFLAPDQIERDTASLLLGAARVAAVLTAVVIGGHFLLRPILRIVANTRIPELFTATALLIVSGTALLMNSVGISMALGAFLAGVLLANTEYRHQLEADIEPFKGLLLGLFFMSVGMGLNLGLMRENARDVALLVAGLMIVKGAVLFAVGRIWDLNKKAAGDFALALPQGGEFAFVIFTAAIGAGLMARDVHDLLVLVVSLSIAATPLARIGYDWLTRGLVPPADPGYDVAPITDHPVIIAGFGRFGQITGRILAAKRIPFIALDASAEQVDFVKRFGAEIYYGDASRLELLRAARAESAQILVLAIDDVEASLRTAETVARHFPHLQIYARSRNRQHTHRLMDLGVRVLRRETFLSALDLTKEVLRGLGVSAKEAERTVKTFQEYDERRLAEHHTHYNDEEKMRGLAKSAAKELEEMFMRDAIEQAADEAKPSRTRAA